MAASSSAGRSRHIPALVSDTITILEQKALQEQGILRVSGSAVQIQDLIKQYEKGKPVDLSKINIHTVAGLLKRYFKDSPESLLTHELYESFIAASAIQETGQRIEEIRTLVEQLPLPNQEILHKLIVFLVHVSEFSEENSMTKGNLSTMFGPQLLRTKDQDPKSMMQDMPKIFVVIHTLIENHQSIFPGWPDDQEIKPGSESSAIIAAPTKKEESELLRQKKQQLRAQATIEKAIAKWYGKQWRDEVRRRQSMAPVGPTDNTPQGGGIAIPLDRPRGQTIGGPSDGAIPLLTNHTLLLPNVNPDIDSESSSENDGSPRGKPSSSAPDLSQPSQGVETPQPSPGTLPYESLNALQPQQSPEDSQSSSEQSSSGAEEDQ